MPGSATLDPDVLVDSLVSDVIDDIREELLPELGNRAFRVYTVVRTWSGGYIGEGEAADVETEITPRPFVHPFAGLTKEMEPCGLDDAGAAKVTEVSLSYTFAELLAGAAPAGAQHLIKITEAHGQAQPVRYFVHAKPPYPDREDPAKGWHLVLEIVEEE